MNFLKKLTANLLIILIAALTITVTVYAMGSFSPADSPAPTGYTLDDLYNKVVYGREPTPGRDKFSPSRAPQRSLAEIYQAINNPAEEGADLPLGLRGLPSNYTVDSVNGTVIDNNTGLMWKRCEEGKSGASCTGSGDEMTWANAIDRCENLSFAGYDDWYLPTIEELTSIVDYTEHSPAIDTAAFPNTESAITWSSTEDVSSSTNAWIVNFSYGTPSNYPKTNSSRVRCVRKN